MKGKHNLDITKYVRTEKKGKVNGSFCAFYDGQAVSLKMTIGDKDKPTGTVTFYLPWGTIYGAYKKNREQTKDKPKEYEQETLL